MVIRRSMVLSALGVLAASTTACSMVGKEQKTDNPTANQVQESQNQSQQALKQAHDAQQKAADQEKKAAEAQANVQKLQQQLTQAQATARQEQAKAQQMQQQANQETRQATQQAQSAQQSAVQGLAQANRQVSRGQMATRGTVEQASNDQVVLKPQAGGNPMTFRVTDQTQVRIDGRQASATDIQQGQDALVSYEAGTLQPQALAIQVQTGTIPGTGNASDQGTGSSSAGTGSSPQGNGSSPSGTGSTNGGSYGGTSTGGSYGGTSNGGTGTTGGSTTGSGR